jgi:hypothetical protein
VDESIGPGTRRAGRRHRAATSRSGAHGRHRARRHTLRAMAWPPPPRPGRTPLRRWSARRQERRATDRARCPPRRGPGCLAPTHWPVGDPARRLRHPRRRARPRNSIRRALGLLQHGQLNVMDRVLDDCRGVASSASGHRTTRPKRCAVRLLGFALPLIGFVGVLLVTGLGLALGGLPHCLLGFALIVFGHHS